MTDVIVASRPDKERVILIAEDNIVNRLVLTGFLDQVPCEIVYAENGAVAVERYKAAKIDLILMDINMPIMDGIEATKEIRALENAARAPHTPIVAVTAHDDAETKQDCDAAGMDAFIPKPVRPDLLIGALSKWV
jgi:CheY-like chemotaxis protein